MSGGMDLTSCPECSRDGLEKCLCGGPHFGNPPEWKKIQKLAGVAREGPVYTGDDEIDAMIADCISTMATKGAEYTVGSPDRLANFRGVASDVGIEMEKAWYVFFNKHLRAVQAYIKNGCKVKSNEPIQGRIMDCIVYLMLFHKMTLEIERNREMNRAEKAG